jgi:small subunit ribosomal protein S1
VGQSVKVQVIRFNSDTQRISLGMKQLEADPWDNAESKYPLGMKLSGRVSNITDYGAFVELEPGIEGLVHVTEMSWTKKNVHPGKIISTSQEVEVIVLDVDIEKRRISLGIKQTQENPWTDFLARHPAGSVIEGEVKNITEFGLFVGLPGDIDGMVHLSDISWEKPGEDAIDDFKKGDLVQAKVLDIDIEKERVSLGIKQLNSDPFEAAAGDLKKGDTVTCTVTDVTDGGLVVSLAGGAPGFIRRSDLSKERSEQRGDRFAEGDRVDALITAIDRRERKVTLSIKQHEIEEERKAMADYGSSDSGASLGDILGAAIRKAEGDTGRDASEEPEAIEKKSE